jgi:hypothetical protein
MTDWDAVVAVGLTLPGVEVGTSYRRPALRFRGGTLAGTTAPDPASFVLHVHAADKELLLESDPATFWQTDHYRGYPVVLVRYGTAEGERIAMLLRRAWWDRATRAQQTAWGARP